MLLKQIQRSIEARLLQLSGARRVTATAVILKKSSSWSDNKDGGRVHIFVVSTKFLFMIAQQSCLSGSIMGTVALSNMDIL